MTTRIVVDTGSPTPPYEQIRLQLAGLIGRGVLTPGQRLPPVRQLAADLGLAVGTVARAYRELELAGRVVSRRGGGTRVALPGSAEDPAAELDGARRSREDETLAYHAAAYVAAGRRLGATDDELVSAVQRAAGVRAAQV